MKVYQEKPKKVFKPVTLTIETEEELILLTALLGVAGKVRIQAAVREVFGSRFGDVGVVNMDVYNYLKDITDNL
jgi:hypothetical protein